MELLPPGWEDIGAKGLVVLFVLMIFLGWLIPKRWHDRAMRDKDETIAYQRETIDSLTAAAQSSAVSMQTAAHALRAVEKQAEKAGGDP